MVSGKGGNSQSQSKLRSCDDLASNTLTSPLMDTFRYRAGKLYCDDLEIDGLISQFGSPLFVYSQNNFVENLEAVRTAFQPIAPMICFSVKSCSNVNLLRLLVEQGAGLDVVSGGELYRALQAGADPSKIVFAGVGKSVEELESAVELDVFLINVESEDELRRLRGIAEKHQKRVKTGIRINPDLVDPTTHAKTATGGRASKFGVPSIHVPVMFEKFRNDRYINLSALHVHLGSPISTETVYVEALRRVYNLIREVQSMGGRLDTLDFGGGFAAHYDRSMPADTLSRASTAITRELEPLRRDGVRFIVEPGRVISANSGILVATVEYIKRGWDKTIVVLDAGMNILIRPTLYGAKHIIWPTCFQNYYGHWQDVENENQRDGSALSGVDVVGPICETGDYFALNRVLPSVKQGQHIAVFSCGAYAMSMASQYNSRPRPAEILVTGSKSAVIRRRESYSDLVALEL